MKKKILSFLFIVMLSTFGATVVFADEIKESKGNNQKIENQVVGKITNINSNYVTIDVVLPNKKIKSDIKNEKESREKRNKDNMFVLTGENKRIDISKAKFIGSKKIISENNNNSNEKSKQLTYSDFQVGDYIMIVLADDGSNVAKIVKKDGFVRKRSDKTIEKNK